MRRRQNILAIDPGLRETGIAHFEGTELVDYGVKSLRRPGNRESRPMLFKKVVFRVLKEKRPDVVVIEKNSFSGVKQNQPLMTAVKGIGILAKRLSIRVAEFAPNTIKKCVTGDGRASKRLVAQVICATYPELRVYTGSNQDWRERYYQNQFDAIACGLTYLEFYEQKQIY